MCGAVPTDLEELVNAQDGEGNTPLHVAVECGHAHLITALLDAPAPANPALRNRLHMAPIHLAVELNRVDCLKVPLFRSLLPLAALLPDVPYY